MKHLSGFLVRFGLGACLCASVLLKPSGALAAEPPPPDAQPPAAPGAGSNHLSANAGEVQRMAESGVGEPVVLAYVENNQAPFDLSAEAPRPRPHPEHPLQRYRISRRPLQHLLLRRRVPRWSRRRSMSAVRRRRFRIFMTPSTRTAPGSSWRGLVGAGNRASWRWTIRGGHIGTAADGSIAIWGGTGFRNIPGAGPPSIMAAGISTPAAAGSGPRTWFGRRPGSAGAVPSRIAAGRRCRSARNSSSVKGGGSTA